VIVHDIVISEPISLDSILFQVNILFSFSGRGFIMNYINTNNVSHT